MAYHTDTYIAIHEKDEKRVLEIIEENPIPRPDEIIRKQGCEKKITVLFTFQNVKHEEELLGKLREEKISFKMLSLGEEYDDNKEEYNYTEDTTPELDDFWLIFERRASWATENDYVIHEPKRGKEK